jgi:signal transduction histidine kinase
MSFESNPYGPGVLAEGRLFRHRPDGAAAPGGRKSSWIGGFIVLAAAYALTGRISLWLAIPPGYASPVWPAAGVALAGILIGGARLWPAIILGSFLVNLWTGLEGTSLTSFARSAWVSIGIGTGAAAQAAVGAALIRKAIGWPNPLRTTAAVMKFLMLGGPLSCFLNALVGTLCLLGVGVIEPGQYWITWGIWWIGDAVGVMVCAPLLLLWIGPGIGASRARRWSVTLPLLGALSLAIAGFAGVRTFEKERLIRDFESSAVRAARAVQRAVHDHQAVLDGLRAFYRSSRFVSRKEFHTFVTDPVSTRMGATGLRALSWNPRVGREERPAFENSVRREGFPDFRITRLDPRGLLFPADAGDTYAPVTYLEPLDGNKKALGFDILSEPLRAHAARRAIDSGGLTATPAVRLAQGTLDQPGMLFLSPVYREGEDTSTPQKRRRAWKGFIAGVIQPGDLIEGALAGAPDNHFHLTLWDASAPSSRRWLGGIEENRAIVLPPIDPEAEPSEGPTWTTNMEVGGRRWELIFRPSPNYFVSFRTWEVWAVLMSGLFFTWLLGALLLVGSGYAEAVEALVRQRTLEVVDAQNRTLLALKDLEVEKRGLVKAQEELNEQRESALRLARDREEAKTRAEKAESRAHEAARIKSEFTSLVSHELRTPLTTIKEGIALVLDGADGAVNANQERHLGIAKRNVDRLTRLINDVLDYQKLEAGRMDFHMEPNSLNEVVAETVEEFLPVAAKRGVVLSTRLEKDLPPIRCDRDRMAQVLANLLSNALKFTPRGTVRISSAQGEEGVRVSVQDEGPGIDPADKEKLFQSFSQLHSGSREKPEGTGLGLAICKRIMEAHGGRIEVDSAPGRGATFTVTLPARN